MSNEGWLLSQGKLTMLCSQKVRRDVVPRVAKHQASRQGNNRPYRHTFGPTEPSEEG